MSERIIGYIEEGIVIDHIPFGKVWKLVEILGVNVKKDGRVSLGAGFKSEKVGKKDILKMEGAIVSEFQLNLIALIAENATVSFIKEGRVVNKKEVSIPQTLKNVVLCTNRNCISNDSHEKVEPLVAHHFENGNFVCHYCGKKFTKKDLSFVSVD